MNQKLKQFLPIFLSLIILSLLPTKSKAVVVINNFDQKSELVNSEIENDFFRVNMDSESNRKSSLKERILLRLTKNKFDKQQKRIKKRAEKTPKKRRGGKLQIIALILCIFFGFLGVHRFYLGYTGMGVIYIFTLGLFGIGWLIDIILLIIPNGLTPKGKTNYRD